VTYRPAQLPIIARAQCNKGRVAAIDIRRTCTYNELLDASMRVARALLAGRADLHEERVAFLLPPGIPWIATLWGIWQAGGIAVPLALSSARPELEYYMGDAGAAAIIFDAATEAMAEPIASAQNIATLTYEEIQNGALIELPDVAIERRAMILYTSGTTNRPKGVVATHANIAAQISTLVEAWEWQADDRTLLCLPLHHVHGIINVVSCALWSGATCEMMTRFDANVVWKRIASGVLTVFMAVPTIYLRLISAWEAAPALRQLELSHAAAKLRLMVSGSAALPVSTLERWKEISGHILLERYGMTEIGMAFPIRCTANASPVASAFRCLASRFGCADRTASRWPKVFLVRSKCAVPAFSQSIGVSPRPRERLFARAGFALAIRLLQKIVSIAFSAAPASIFSRPADIRFPR